MIYISIMNLPSTHPQDLETTYQLVGGRNAFLAIVADMKERLMHPSIQASLAISEYTNAEALLVNAATAATEARVSGLSQESLAFAARVLVDETSTGNY